MSITLRSEYDVAIVGAGPAGSSAAIRLARSGLKVLLIEQKTFPRAKLCGEFISPECLAHFAELDVLDDMSLAGGVSIKQTVFYARHGRAVTVPNAWFSADGEAIGLSRAEMDHKLLTRARIVGVDVMEETNAAAMLFDSEKVCAVRMKNKDREIFEVKATLTVDATGRSRFLAKQIGISNETEQRKRADFVAFKAHLINADIHEGACEIYAYRGGYGGCTRVENGHYNLCFIVSTQVAKKHANKAVEIMKNVVCENQRAARSLRNAEVVDDWLAVPIERYGRSSLAPANGLLTIGDTAAFIDPFTGSGILLALESAKIAANVITNGFRENALFTEIAKKYELQYSKAFDRRLRISSFVRHAAFVPFLAEAVIKTLSLSDRVTFRLAKSTRQ